MLTNATWSTLSYSENRRQMPTRKDKNRWKEKNRAKTQSMRKMTIQGRKKKGNPLRNKGEKMG